MSTHDSLETESVTLPVRVGSSSSRSGAVGSAGVATTSRNGVYRRLLAVADLTAATAAFVITIPVLGHDSLGLWALVAILMVVPVCKLAGLYDRDGHLLHKTTLDEAPALFTVATFYTLLAFLAGLNIVDGVFGRAQAAVLWISLFALMLLMRAFARWIAGALVEDERCLIVANANAAHWLATKLERSPGARTHVVGRVPFSPHDTSSDELPLLGGFESIEHLIAEHRVDRALIAPGKGDDDHQLLNAIRVV
ncbi:MAG: nucleoside-diphosphate sugar epimerase/dehydratase, partial [Trebonia sp.]